MKRFKLALLPVMGRLVVAFERYQANHEAKFIADCDEAEARIARTRASITKTGSSIVDLRRAYDQAVVRMAARYPS